MDAASGFRPPQPPNASSRWKRPASCVGYTVEIDPQALGLEVLAFIRMSCAGQNYYRLLEYVHTLEEVRECHHLTGGDDFLLKVTTTDMADLEALLKRCFLTAIPLPALFCHHQ